MFIKSDTIIALTFVTAPLVLTTVAIIGFRDADNCSSASLTYPIVDTGQIDTNYDVAATMMGVTVEEVEAVQRTHKIIVRAKMSEKYPC